ncbi:hypothetical protein Pla123a_10200 [Posidoniimonas polymericola]|uniref:LTD domain-containing protein n=1 Tax=Posidoniimonas polymericola TaxID=2528002 RepID=A0A5C5YTV0_9BACT|nr:hypothetical protein [Posidoniimonas polymericola]TWT78230.1 hypothetical protein Pla123a_10200 [Posidoniimonas polymericola]
MSKAITGVAVLAAVGVAALAAAATPTIRFSEYLLDAPGTDGGREFIEISGPPNASLDGLSIIEIEGDGGSAGIIDGFFDLTGLTLGSNGLLLLRDEPIIPISGVGDVPAVLAPTPAAETNVEVEGVSTSFAVGDYNSSGRIDAADYTVYRDLVLAGEGTLPNDGTPDVVDSADYTAWQSAYGSYEPAHALFNRAGDIENGSITMVLARDFNAGLDVDLDFENDGVLDILPWSEVLDAVGFNEGPVPGANEGDPPALNNSYGKQLGGVDFEGTLSGLDAVPGISATLDGYVLLSDGAGGYIRAAFDPDESNESNPEFFFDDGGVLSLIDTSPLGPWTADMAPGFPEMVTVDETGALFFVTPETTAITGELFGAPGLVVLNAEGLPIDPYWIVSPGNLNLSGVVGDSILTPAPSAIASAPEPSAVWLASALALVVSFKRR